MQNKIKYQIIVDTREKVNEHIVNKFIDASNYKELFKLKIDYIIDCCDTVSTKILLINECLNRNIKIWRRKNKNGNE